MAPSEPISAHVLTLADLFSDRYRFRLPYFQRAYSWTIEQVTRLLADLIEAGRKPQERRRYFLGCLLLARPQGDSLVAVIDGHQRVVTVSILFAVLRDLAEAGPERQRLAALLTADQPGLPDNARALRLVPHAGLAPFLEHYVQADGATRIEFDGDEAELSETEANVIANRDYLRRALTGAENAAELRRDLARFLIEQCRVEVLEVEDELEAWSMLEVEEQTRLDFNATDRAKASILSAMAAPEREVCGQIWETCQDRLGTKDMRALLAHVRTLELRRRSDIPVETELIREFELQRNGVAFFRNTLVPRAEALARLQSRALGTAADRAAIAASLDRTCWLDEQLWVPTALRWLEVRGAEHAETRLFFERLERLVWLMRIGGVDPLVQQNRILRLLTEIDSAVLVANTKSLAIEPRLLSMALDSLRSRTFYSKHYSGAVLRRISIALGADSGHFDRISHSIEHVLPRNPPQRRAWWQSFTSKELVHAYANRIGNLTLLSSEDNQLTAARDYAEKRAILASSNFILSRLAAREEEWTPRIIERRTQALIDTLLEAWGLDPIQ